MTACRVALLILFAGCSPYSRVGVGRLRCYRVTEPGARVCFVGPHAARKLDGRGPSGSRAARNALAPPGLISGGHLLFLAPPPVTDGGGLFQTGGER